MQDQPIPNYQFLSNQPLGEDLFKNKSQEKIAGIISNKIINEANFKIVGIDGTWGSGKSNLVRLIQKNLEETHQFFIYDVWGHQEDEQRKAILVEFTEFITNKKHNLVSNKGNWRAKLDQLLANSKITKTENIPYLSVGFIFSLLSIIYIPIVNVFKDGMSDYFGIEKWYWKLLLVAFPILIVIGIYIYNLFRNWFNKKGFCKSFRLSAEDTFQVYTNKQKEETKIETISEQQPTVRDFQKWMEEIDKDLNKKVVIVFDNFDRLPRKHILNIWSSIHIFFAEKPYSNIKVILPFDREHVQNAFKELNNGNNSTFADDYINKTFDVVFRVSLPIMSDWKQFFENQWKIAFQNFNAVELKLVIQVYEFLHRRITPREIISFINEVLTVKLLNHDYKERYISIFVLLKDDILNEPLKAITDLDYLKGLKSVYGNDPDYAKQLTAIVYHLDVENALELIYTQELKDALNKGDTIKFNQICGSDFGDAIFTSAISDIEILENPITTLSKIDDNSKVSAILVKQAWKRFYDMAIASNQQPDVLDIEEWQLILVNNYADDEFLKRLLSQYADKIEDTTVSNYIALIDKIVQSCGKERVHPLLKTKAISAANQVKIIGDNDNEYQFYQLTTSDAAMDAYLSELELPDLLDIDHTRIICNHFALPGYKVSLKALLKKAADEGNTEDANNILVKLMETARPGKNAALKGILDDSSIYTLYQGDAKSDIANDLIAMRIAAGSSFNSTYSTYFESILEASDPVAAEQISKVILHYITYTDLLLLSEQFDDSELFKEIILNLFEDDDQVKDADTLILINHYAKIKEGLSITDDHLLVELNKFKLDPNDLDVNRIDATFASDSFTNHELSISKIFINRFNEDFKTLDNEGYEVVFDEQDNIHFMFFNHLRPDSLTQLSLDVFKEKFIAKIKSKSADESWWKVLEKYERNRDRLSIENTLKDLRDQFINGHIELDLQTVNHILPYFIQYNLLDATTDIFRTIIKNTFLNNTGFVQILLKNAAYIKSLYQATPQNQKEDFRNLINERRGENEAIEALAKSIDIRKPANPKVEENKPDQK
ncbi:P-loop NTPase fold protein [Niabella aquatica]